MGQEASSSSSSSTTHSSSTGHLLFFYHSQETTHKQKKKAKKDGGRKEREHTYAAYAKPTAAPPQHSNGHYEVEGGVWVERQCVSLVHPYRAQHTEHTRKEPPFLLPSFPSPFPHPPTHNQKAHKRPKKRSHLASCVGTCLITQPANPLRPRRMIPYYGLGDALAWPSHQSIPTHPSTPPT